MQLSHKIVCDLVHRDKTAVNNIISTLVYVKAPVVATANWWWLISALMLS